LTKSRVEEAERVKEKKRIEEEQAALVKERRRIESMNSDIARYQQTSSCFWYNPIVRGWHEANLQT